MSLLNLLVITALSETNEIIPGLFSVYSRADKFMEVDHVEMKDKFEQY